MGHRDGQAVFRCQGRYQADRLHPLEMGQQGQRRRACARQGFMSEKNLLTDVAGVSVGHADDAALASGVTAILFDRPAVASVDVRGGGPGTRDETLLDPVSTVEAIDAITLS